MKIYYLYIALTLTILIPAGIGIAYFHRFRPQVKIFIALMLTGAANEVLMVSMGVLGIRNLYTLHVYTLAELVLLSVFYHQAVKDRRIKKAIWFIVPSVISISVVYSAIGNNLYDFNSIPRAVESLFLICLAGYYFYEVAVTGDSDDPFRDGVFFINGSLLFYFSSSFVIFAVSKYMNTVSNDSLLTMYSVHSFVNAFCNLVFGFGLWKIASRTFSLAQ